MTIQHKYWFTLHSQQIDPVLYPAVAVVEVWHSQPVRGDCSTGMAMANGIEVQWFDVLDPYNSAGSIGYLDFINDANIYGIMPYSSCALMEISEAEYGLHVAFDLLPVVPFINYPTLHPYVDPPVRS
jgi:hypothetical protein